MALTHSEAGKLGSQAPDFRLLGVDGKTYALSDYLPHPEVKGLVVVFMCNHCPYVLAVKDRINALAKKSAPMGVPVIGINSNDAVKYPDDSFENMQLRSKEWGFVFPYLFDETQNVARAYGAVCTPDFYLLEKHDGKFTFRYRGRLDDSWKDASQVQSQDLWEEIQALSQGKPLVRATLKQQLSSMGCSLKWKIS